MFHSIHEDSRCGLSLAALIRQVVTVRKTWLEEVCVRGRPCAPPPHLNRSIFRNPLTDDLAPLENTREFDSDLALRRLFTIVVSVVCISRYTTSIYSVFFHWVSQALSFECWKLIVRPCIVFRARFWLHQLCTRRSSCYFFCRGLDPTVVLVLFFDGVPLLSMLIFIRIW